MLALLQEFAESFRLQLSMLTMVHARVLSMLIYDSISMEFSADRCCLHSQYCVLPCRLSSCAFFQSRFPILESSILSISV